MASAVAAAAARWGHVGVTTRLLLLVALQVAITVAAEHAMKYVAIVGRVLIHLCAYLVLPTAIVSAAQLGGSWRVDIAVGGAVATLAVWWQGRRRSAPLLTGSTAAGLVVAAAGMAALVHAPLAALVGVLSVGFAAAGSRRRTSLLVGIGVSLPILGLLAEYGVGSGTLREMGAVGPLVATGGVVAGIAGAVSLIAVSRACRSRVYGACALGSFGTALLWASHVIHLPSIDGVLITAVVLIATEIALLFAERSSSPLGSTAVVHVAPTVDFAELLLAVALPLLAGSSVRSATALGLGLALIAGTFRKKRVIDILAPATVGAGLVGLAVGLASPTQGWSVGLAIATVVLAVESFVHRRSHLGDLSAAAAAATFAVAVAQSFGTDHVLAGGLVSAVGLVAVGLQFVTTSRRPLMIFGLVTVAASPLLWWTWPAVIVAGAVWVTVGRLRNLIAVEVTGLAGAVLGVFLTIDSSSLRDRSDLVAALVVGLLVVGESELRRFVPSLSSKREESFIPACLFGAVYLAQAVVGASTGRVAAVAAIGIAMTASATLLRHRIGVVCGVVVSAASVIVAADESLRSLPLWVWVMVGGLGLLGVAAFQERRRAGRSSAHLMEEAESRSMTTDSGLPTVL